MLRLGVGDGAGGGLRRVVWDGCLQRELAKTYPSPGYFVEVRIPKVLECLVFESADFKRLSDPF